MAFTKIKAEVNKPIRGYLQSCKWCPERTDEAGKKWSAQWALHGRWAVLTDGTWGADTEATIYLDDFQVPTSPVALGIVEQLPEISGVPQFRIREQGQIQLVKREDGRKRVIQIARVGAATSAGFPPPMAPVAIAAMHVAATAPTTASQPTPAYMAQWTKEMSANLQPADEWAALEARYARCAEIARNTWHHISDEQALVAAAATIFIASDKAHMSVPISASLGTTGGESPTPTKVTVDTSGPPVPEQIAQFRALLGTDDPYGGGPVFDQRERQELMAQTGNATAMTLNAAILRMQKTIVTRTTRTPPPATRTAGGPGMPGAFDQMPETLDEDLDSSLPF